jgi:hypothetical protein
VVLCPDCGRDLAKDVASIGEGAIAMHVLNHLQQKLWAVHQRFEGLVVVGPVLSTAGLAKELETALLALSTEIENLPQAGNMIALLHARMQGKER